MKAHFDLARLTPAQRRLRRRLLAICHRHGYTHLGSSLTALDLIAAVYAVKQRADRFVLSNGHAAMALYVVLADRGQLTPRQLARLNIHPDRNPRLGIDVSTGSLGQGLPIALGMALADPRRRVFCLISDGECAEGSIWEALRIAADAGVRNLRIIVNANGWAAYDAVAPAKLARRLRGFGYELLHVNGHEPATVRRALQRRPRGPALVFAATTVAQFPFLHGLSAHYYRMQAADYRQALEALA